MKFVNIFYALSELVSRYQVAIYVTIIFHLCVAITLVSLKLHRASHPPTMEIVLDDFSDEEAEKLEALQRKKMQLEQEVNQLLRQSSDPLRNVAVNEEWEKTNEGDRDELLNEHDELQKKLAATRQMLNRQEEEQQRSAAHSGNDVLLQANRRSAAGNTPEKSELYTGPSVMSYRLAGRRAFVLPVPVYLCESGGDVVVNIVVAGNGSVTGAHVDEKASAAYPCIREAARQAALLSKFSVSESSKSQQGSITYRFIPQ
ncbi:MAG: hypothetical protein LBF67_09780 [Prevotellaceae bacterium]|jgi:hypothetical protein|nr:hypothetical protein [Prevotellaceae bacterium]